MQSDDITIPPEAVEAAARVLHDHAEIFDDVPWQDLSDGDQEAYLDEATAAIRAALTAWPGMRVKAVLLADTVLLPLPQENPDAEA